MLGYGYPVEGLKRAMREDIAFIGVDAGSTDPGPYYLGSGKGFVKELQIRRDLEPALLAAREKNIPLIIGSAGGSGARPHVDSFCSILLDLAFPFPPSDLQGGAVYEFSLYHLLQTNRQQNIFPVKYVDV